MSIALLVRIEALERRVAPLEAALVSARSAAKTDKPAPAKKKAP